MYIKNYKMKVLDVQIAQSAYISVYDAYNAHLKTLQDKQNRRIKGYQLATKNWISRQMIQE